MLVVGMFQLGAISSSLPQDCRDHFLQSIPGGSTTKRSNSKRCLKALTPSPWGPLATGETVRKHEGSGPRSGKTPMFKPVGAAVLKTFAV